MSLKLRRKRLGFETRFSAQLAPTDRRSVWRRLSYYGVILVILAGGWFFLYAPYWQIQTVTVEGLVHISEGQIAAAVPAVGQNIFRFNASHARTVISGMSEVYSLRIIRRLPRTLAVVVTEREPVFVWKTTQALYDVDSTGTVFRLVPNGEDLGGLFVVSDMANVHVAVGQRAVPSRFMSAYGVIARALPTIYPDLIDHLEVGETVYDLDVVMKDGRRVRFNVLSDVAAQLSDLQRIKEKRADLFARSVIDLRVDRWAYVK